MPEKKNFFRFQIFHIVEHPVDHCVYIFKFMAEIILTKCFKVVELIRRIYRGTIEGEIIFDEMKALFSKGPCHKVEWPPILETFETVRKYDSR